MESKEVAATGFVVPITCATLSAETGAGPSMAVHPIGLMTALRFRVTVNTGDRLIRGLEGRGAAEAGRRVWLRLAAAWLTSGGSPSM